VTDIPDNASVRSGYSTYSQFSRGSLQSLNTGIKQVNFTPQQQVHQKQQAPHQTIETIPEPSNKPVRKPINELVSEDAFLTEFPELTLIDDFRYLKRERERAGMVLMGSRPSCDSEMDISKL
jgi:hypothetical protein